MAMGSSHKQEGRKIMRRMIRGTCSLLLVASTLGPWSGTTLAGGRGGSSTSGNSVSGEAYGAFVDVSLLGTAQANVGKAPRVVLPPSGGMEKEQVAKIGVPGALVSETLTVITTGAIGSGVASAQSSSTVEQVNVLNGLVTASLVVAISSSTGNGSSATSRADGSILVGLVVNGKPLGDLSPASNTVIGIPGVGSVILNEQIRASDGSRSTALTVNMIHVALDGALGTGDVIVASAHSDVNFAPSPIAETGLMTGGGRLGTGRDIATFGLHAGVKKGAPDGNLQYQDHADDLNVHAAGVDSFSRSAASPCVTFSGPARVNNAAGFRFTVRLACDNGEPGVGRDTLDISVSGPGVSYSRSGVLTGGNLQLH
jgi:hypothetical protein